MRRDTLLRNGRSYPEPRRERRLRVARLMREGYTVRVGGLDDPMVLVNLRDVPHGVVLGFYWPKLAAGDRFQRPHPDFTSAERL